ncbi:hypothetical protein EDC94DRAFT_690459 [Helicostylum pulchrum]|nr:hypothetical protein EDC94DRAFT_690459 [Helicostylum pulchrum]
MKLVMNGPTTSPNNDIKEKVLEWFRSVPKFQRNIPTLQNELRTVILPAAIENHTLNVEVDDSGAITNPLSIECIKNKLIQWGFHFKRVGKVIYFVGHEREDVVTYRKERSQRIVEYQRYAETYGYEEVSVAIPPALPDNIRLISLYRIGITILKNDPKMVNMNDSSIMNTTINENGKRIILPDPFNSPGGESSALFNRLLEQTSDTINLEVDDTDNGEDEDLYSQQLAYQDQSSIEIANVVKVIKDWKLTAPYIPLLHKQNLLFYFIVDRDCKDCQVLTASHYNVLNAIETNLYYNPSTVVMEPLDFSTCNSFPNLTTFYNNNKHNLPYPIKKIIKVFINQKYEENVNLFTDTSQKEDDYKFHFIAPLFKALFRHNNNIKKEWGESTISRIKVDGLLSLLDGEDGIVSLLSIVEVSGPWSITDNNHFMRMEISRQLNGSRVTKRCCKFGFLSITIGIFLVVFFWKLSTRMVLFLCVNLHILR